jgi:hypothetical protein
MQAVTTRATRNDLQCLASTSLSHVDGNQEFGEDAMSAPDLIAIGALTVGVALSVSCGAIAAESLAGFSFEPPAVAGWTGARSEVPPGKLWLGNGTDFNYENRQAGGVDEFASARVIRFFQPHEPRAFIATVKTTVRLLYDRPPMKVLSFSLADDDDPGAPCVRYHVVSEVHRPPAVDRSLLLEGWTCANPNGAAYVELVAGVIAPTASLPASLPAPQAAFLRSLRVTSAGTP